MTIPLIVLAVLSTFGGLIGIPEALGGSHWLSQWLSPVIKHVGEAPDHATEYMLMAVSLVGVLISIGVAYNKYVKQNHIPIQTKASVLYWLIFLTTSFMLMKFMMPSLESL